MEKAKLGDYITFLSFTGRELKGWIIFQAENGDFLTSNSKKTPVKNPKFAGIWCKPEQILSISKY